MLTEDRLRTLLRVAESAHGAYETELRRAGTRTGPPGTRHSSSRGWQEEPGGGSTRAAAER